MSDLDYEVFGVEKKYMVIGVFSKSSDVEPLLNNLEEADFDPKNISVAMKDQKSVNTIANVSGPLTGAFKKLITKLKSLGISQTDIQTYQTIIQSGGVLISVSGSSTNEAAKEMLEDSNAQNIKIVNEE